MLLGVLALGLSGNSVYAQVFATPTRSTNIALTRDDRRLLVVNRDKDSLSIIAVRNADGQDVRNKLTEIAVGQEPRCVAILPDDSKAYVTNAISGTVSVVALRGPDAYSVINEIRVGNEPRGCALTPNGNVLYVANHTDGNVSAISTESDSEIRKITLNACPNPQAIAITNDGDDEDRDERVFVTNFFADLIQDGPGEGFDTGKRGVVCSFIVLDNAAAVQSVVSPLDDAGFTANRALFCPQCNPNLHSDIFCPDTTLACTDAALVSAPQGAFPNQLFSALIRRNRLFLPSIGAAPAPPVIFNNNVQALVHQINTNTLVEIGALTQNLNVQIAIEPIPNPAQGSLQHAFLDPVAIDANRAGTRFLIVSRGGNFVVRATIDDAGTLNLDAPNVIRYETGNIPTGVVINSTGRRAYVNNEVDLSVTVLNLQTDTVIEGDIDSSEPPSPNTFEHSRQVGKLAFTTSLGVPDNGIFEREIRSIVPKRDRGKASRDAWSSCASCHPDGLTDNVTWIFDTGPRNTISLDAFTSKRNPADQRISNWSAVRVSNTEFNLNSRNVQGGCGFASDGFAPPEQCNIQFNQTPQHPGIFNLGRTVDVSDALDSWSLWVQTVRTLNMPQPRNQEAFRRGRQVFAANCASCHGGAQWTKSQVVFTSNPVRPCATCAPLDDGLTISAAGVGSGGEIVSYAAADEENVVRTLQILEDVGTFNVNNDLELRGLGLFGQQALGQNGFNPPSLLMVRYTAPYLHQGRARNLRQVFNLHRLPNGQTIANTLSGQQVNDLTLFVNAIDSRTRTVDSDTDTFLDDLVGLP
jgi:YVTN family beta-propeller protein